MARLSRLAVPGLVHHVSQRGNNGQAIVSSVADFSTFLRLLGEAALEHGVRIHAYLLMSAHFHALATPETVTSLPKLMQSIGRRYARYFNDANDRSGALWDGRYKSTVIEAERHLLEAMVYLDLEPVETGLVATPSAYAWSSHAHYVGLRADKLITQHPTFWQLGNTPFEREAAYSARVNQGCNKAQRQALEQALRGGWVWGSPAFSEEIGAYSKRRVAPAQPGRPSAKRKQ